MLSRILLVLRGFLMGAADVIPGVSGGTVALIVGIYEKLVFSIRSVGLSLLRSIFRRAWWSRVVAIILGRGEMKPPEALGGDSPEAKLERDAQITAFLVLLLLGVGVAVLTMVKVLPRLMQQHPELMSGFFFGLVLASAWIPFSKMRRRGPVHALSFVAAGVATFFLMGVRLDTSTMGRGELVVRGGLAGEALVLPAGTTFTTEAGSRARKKRLATYVQSTAEVRVGPGQAKVRVPVVATRAGRDTNLAAGSVTRLSPPVAGLSVDQPAPLSGGQDTPLWYIFLCGAIAICAMILPGVSGSFLLLMLGQYGYVLHKVYVLVYERNTEALPIVGVFLAGIVVGILAFSRVLNWLLRHAHDVTMATLTGLMVGSLRKLWPFRATDGITERNVLPESLDATVGLTLACFVAGIAIISVLAVLARRQDARSTA